MLNTVVDLLKTAFDACIGWFEQIMEKTGMLPFYLGGQFIFFAVGFLLSPLRNGLPGGLSDSVARTYWANPIKKQGKYQGGTFFKVSRYKGKFEN